jgi:pimeloyl-ACP methyl ester carboxylesterase
VLRAALGRGQLDYFGASYGTKLGATYAQLFPTKVGRFVLDGAVDPTLTNLQLNLQQAAGFETALRAYVQNCTEASSCFLGSSVDEGLAKIKTFLAQVDDNPLPTDSDRDLTLGNAFYGIVAPLYNRDYWVILSQALKAGMGGDGSVLMQLSDLYSSRDTDGSYTDNSTEANYAINCLDDPSSIPASQVPSVLPEFEKASPTFGDVFAWSTTNCSGVQTKAEEPYPVIQAAGAAPIVVVGTSRDPATPYQWAVNLAGQLESGVLVSRDGDGHTAYMSGNSCIDRAVEDYLVDDTVPEDGLKC